MNTSVFSAIILKTYGLSHHPDTKDCENTKNIIDHVIISGLNTSRATKKHNLIDFYFIYITNFSR
jgi:hypothetical protein